MAMNKTQTALIPAIIITFVQLGLYLIVGLQPSTALVLSVSLLASSWGIYLFFARQTEYAGSHSKPKSSSSPARPSKEKSSEANKTLQIACATLPFLRQGLNRVTAQKIAEIIKSISDVAAVAITDREHVLSFIGAGCEMHRPGDDILTAATKHCIATSTTQIIKNQRELNCPRNDCDCPLDGAVIVPLKNRDEVVGSLKLYEKEAGGPPEYTIRLAEGLGQLLNMQIELAELDRQTQLKTKAELDALRAQINPHFLFNTLNTIIMYSRVDPTKAREMLIKLSEFFRLALKKPGHFYTFADELAFVQNYLYLEEHRFTDRLKITYTISPEVNELPFPELTLQPLVENAIRHGLSPKIGPGHLQIEATVAQDLLVVKVSDNGVGMDEKTKADALITGQGSGFGVGLSNVYERLKRIYGPELVFEIDSAPNAGTQIKICFPWNKAQLIGGMVSEFTGTDS